MIDAWIKQAAKGDTMEYHRGFLILDRDAAESELDAKTRRQLNTVACLAYEAAQNRQVHLIQVRHGPEDYSYMMIK